jgi:hypothetical protein
MSEGPVVVQQVAEATTLLAKASAAALWQLSDDELETAVEAVLAAESALAAARAVVVAATDERGLRSRTQAPTTVRWLTERMRVSRPWGERLVREADLLTSEPVLREALAAGRCTPEQAVVVGSVLAGLPPVADEVRARAMDLMVEQCASLGPMALARAGRHLHEQLVTAPDVDDPDEQAKVDAEAEQRADDAYRKRSLTWRRHLDGSISGRFRFDPAGGQSFLTAVSALSAKPDGRAGAWTVSRRTRARLPAWSTPLLPTRAPSPNVGPMPWSPSSSARPAPATCRTRAGRPRPSSSPRRSTHSRRAPSQPGCFPTAAPSTRPPSVPSRATPRSCPPCSAEAARSSTSAARDACSLPPSAAPSRCATRAASTRAVTPHLSTATRITLCRGTPAEPATSTTDSCSAGTTTDATTARAGPSAATRAATPTSLHRPR